MFQNAYSIAMEAFKGKTCKGGKPYFQHLQRVAESVRHLGEAIRTIAMLHDLLEDCPEWTPERLVESGFSTEVVEGVIAMTRGKGETYPAFIERLAGNTSARLVKMADLKDNMDVSRLKTLTEKDIERLKKYLSAYQYLSQVV